MNILDTTEESLLLAAQKLQKAEIVAFPTETVYGLGADALNEQAVRKIFAAKGRPADNPLIIHIAEENQLEKLIAGITKDAQKLIEAFWPGPLTLVLEKTDIVPEIVTGGLQTVAIRMPKHEVARKLITYAKTPLAAPSANTSGKPSPTQAKHVIEDLQGKISYVIDGGETDIGLESTVYDVQTNMILRQGAITQQEIEDVLQIKITSATSDTPTKSPGMKYTHYAPEVELLLVKQEEISVTIERHKEKRIGLLTTRPTELEATKKIVMGEDPIHIAKHLFAILREFKKEEVDIIICQTLPEHGIGKAIMNRLKKAATHD